MLHRLPLIIHLLCSMLYAQQVKESSVKKPAVIREGPSSEKTPEPALVTSVLAADLAGFSSYPRPVQGLVESALALTRQDLTYTFGSADPKNGGMDCSGCIHYVLRFNAISDVPRQSTAMAEWVRAKGTLNLTPTATSLQDAEFAALKPGDLVFWTGTWEREGRGSAVSHVMLYLGKSKVSGRPLLFGSSDGRTYQGSSQRGVSVFDFTLPKAGGKAALYGYGPVPGLVKNPPKPAAVVSTVAATSAVASSMKDTVKPAAVESKVVPAATAPAITVRKAEPAASPAAVVKPQSTKAPPATTAQVAKPVSKPAATATAKPVAKPAAKPAATKVVTTKPTAKPVAKPKPSPQRAVATPPPQRKPAATSKGLPTIKVDPKKALRRLGDALEDLFSK